MHPATRDPLLSKYVDDNYLYNVFEALISGLAVMLPEAPRVWIVEKLGKVYDIGNENVRWDSFIDPRMRPQHPFVAQDLFRGWFWRARIHSVSPSDRYQPTSEMFVKACHTFNQNLLKKCFRAWKQLVHIKAARRIQKQTMILKANKFRKLWALRYAFDAWSNWTSNISKRRAVAISRIRQVHEDNCMKSCIQKWRKAAKDARELKERFKLPAHGGLQDEDDASLRPGSGVLPGSKITYRDTLKKFPELLRMKIFEYLNPFDVGHSAQVSHNWMSIAERSYSNYRLDLSSLRNRIQDKILAKILKKRRVYLRYINLSGCDLLTQAGFRFLGTCVHLQDVNLSCCNQLTDEAVMHLMWECRDTVKLDLSHTPVTDSAVRYLATAPNVLEHLILANCVKLSSACRAYLKESAGFRALIYLDLSGCVQLESDALMEIFSSFPNVRHWILNNLPQISNEALKVLGSCCPIIETISLKNSGTGLNPARQEPSENNVENQDTAGDEISTIVVKAQVKKRTSKQLSPSKHPVDDEGLSWVVKIGIQKLFVSGLTGCRGHCFKQLAAETHNRKPSWNKPSSAISMNRNGQPMELIRQLYMVNCSELTDSIVRDLMLFPSLVVINLSRCTKLTDAGVKCIAQSAYASKLRELYLAGCGNLTDRSIICLDKQLPQLTYFSVAYCARISKPGLMRLDRWKGLWQLNISGTDLDNRGLAAIGNLPRLHELKIAKCYSIVDAGLEKFAQRAAHLEFVDLSFCNLTDSSTEYISIACSYLRTLDVSGCLLMTVNSLKHLKKGCKRLECLLINGCHQIEKRDVLRWTDRIPHVAHSLNKPRP
ncbi:F-box/LRR-repeat protein 13 [Clonorchis sinensis]|uniref:F-box/LRR-repeat protein 13 n=1 Tax=Clonorchis sinensis TaxID=79923 RepID=G7Y5U0_CLOSI|nr:F-box/LRR-repeat protein 13 [Clonorchis sinensis]